MHYKKAVSFVCCWWMLWALVSYSADRLFPPSPLVYYLVFLFCMGLLIGSVSCSSLGIVQGPRLEAEEFIRKYIFNLKILMIPVLCGMTWVFYKSFLLVLHSGLDLSSIRASFYQYTYNWFPKKILWSIYILLSGIVIHLLIISVLPLFLQKVRLPSISFIVLMIGEAFANGSRGLLYSTGILALFYSWFFLSELRGVSLKKGTILLCIFLLSVIGLYVVSKARGDSLIERGKEYHLVGLTLLSNVVEKRQGYEKDAGYLGRYCLGGGEYFFDMFIRAFVEQKFSSPAMDSVKLQSLPVPTGMAPDSSIHFLNNNTFYTILSSPYRDFGDIGVLVFGILAGYLLTYYEVQYDVYRSCSALTWLTFYGYNVIMGLFGVTLETPGFWAVLVLLIYLEKPTKKFSFQRTS